MNTSPINHPEEQTLLAFLDAEIENPDAVVIHDHLRQCTACRARIRALATTLDMLRDALATPIEGATHLSAIGRSRLRDAAQRGDNTRDSWCDPFGFRFMRERGKTGNPLHWLVGVAAMLVAGFMLLAILMPAASRGPREAARRTPDIHVAMEMSGPFQERWEMDRMDRIGDDLLLADMDFDDVVHVPDVVDTVDIPPMEVAEDALDDAGLVVAPEAEPLPGPPPPPGVHATVSSPGRFRGLYASRSGSGDRSAMLRAYGGRQEGAGRLGGRLLPDAPRRRPEEPAVQFNPVVETASQPISTFSIDTDTAAYTMARRAILAGERPDPEMVRPEEFINYFDYHYPAPRDTTFGVTTVAAPSPFRPGFTTLQIGVRGTGDWRDVPPRRSALTLLLDGSGSMNTPDRIGMVRRVMPLLLEGLHADDLITLVRFDRTPRLLLGPTPAGEKDRIMAVIHAMEPGGATNLEEGLRAAYDLATRHYLEHAANRVLLFTDGVANLGAETAEAILETVDAHRRDGIDLTVFGLGMGTYDDRMLKKLATQGNGSYHYLDSVAEARRLFVEETAAAWHVIARDVRIQVAFDAARVERYRQIGYEPRQLAPEQFRDADVAAGGVGYGKSVTALYELVLTPQTTGPLGVIRVRYRAPDTHAWREIERPITDVSLLARYEDAPPRFWLATAIAEWAEWLRGNPVTAGVRAAYIREELARVSHVLPLDRKVREALQLMDGSGMLRE